MSKSSSHNISHKTFFTHCPQKQECGGPMRTYLHPTGLKQEVFASYRFGLRSPRTIVIDIPEPMLHVMVLFQQGSYTVLDKLPRTLPMCIGGAPQAHPTCVSLTYVTHPSSVAPSPAIRDERERTCCSCYIGANIKW